jgi:MFS family permease
MFIGSLVVVCGAIVMGTSGLNGNLGQFMGGRFLCGFGVTIASSAGPMYVIEVSHPAYRGIIGAFYNTWWYVIEPFPLPGPFPSLLYTLGLLDQSSPLV